MDIVWNPIPRIAEDVIHLDDLQISFKRTVRVPDNDEISALPPGLGNFPLYEVQKYANLLPANMAAKEGLFFAMYRRFHIISPLAASNAA